MKYKYSRKQILASFPSYEGKADMLDDLLAIKESVPTKPSTKERGEHLGDVSWCECDCHTSGSPQPKCDKCYGNPTKPSTKKKIEKLKMLGSEEIENTVHPDENRWAIYQLWKKQCELIDLINSMQK